MLPDFTQIIERLAAVPPPLEPVPSKRAAVAMSLRLGLRGPELLMIQRAVRAGDPWSGHMGFPGGRRDATDGSDIACAKRETHEEIGVDLDVYGQLICQLSDLSVIPTIGHLIKGLTPFCCPFRTPYIPVEVCLLGMLLFNLHAFVQCAGLF